MIINEKATDVVSTVELLGLKISNELRWNYNVTEISKKVSVRSILSKVVKKGKRRVHRPRDIYTTCIHPITENVCAVFHNGLPVYNNNNN